MKKVTLKYKRGRIILLAILIVAWAALVTFSLVEIIAGKDYSISTYIWLILGTVYIVSYGFGIYKHYVTIKGNWLYRNELPFKKIDLDKLREVKKFAGDYTLKTDQAELVISTQIMDEQSRHTFETIIENKYPSKFV